VRHYLEKVIYDMSIEKYKQSSNDSYIINVTKDGNQWCALLGNDLQDGIAGFGEHIHKAVEELAWKLRIYHVNEIEDKERI